MGNPCDSKGDNQECNCQGQDDHGGCDGALCDSTVYQDTGEQDEYGSDIMEIENGDRMVECGQGAPGTVIMSPR